MTSDQTPQGPTIYNPRELTKDELVRTFVAREPILDRLLTAIRADSGRSIAQHHLLVGMRGMGKTTMLHRLRYAVEDDRELAAEWLPITFSEEQHYDVDRLSVLYLNGVDALCDRLDELGMSDHAEAIDDQVDSLPTDEQQRAAAAKALLLTQSSLLGKRLILLIDNFVTAVERLSDPEAWSLRSLLQEEDRLLLIGASTNLIDKGKRYRKPFLDFFRVHELEPLTAEETHRMMISLATRYGSDHVLALIEREPSRLQTLHVLSGGNPRTVMLMYKVLAFRSDGSLEDQLKRTLDEVTPIYKARIDELPAQLQKVFHGLATQWDPISAGELAKALQLDVNKVSTQLNRLARMGMIQKVPYVPVTKTGFQVAERFLNVWYVMRRASRRLRRKLNWLVDILKWFYGRDELSRRARRHLAFTHESEEYDRISYAEEGLLLSKLVEEPDLRAALEVTSLTALLRKSAPERLGYFLDLDGHDREFKPQLERIEQIEELRRLIAECPNLTDRQRDELTTLICGGIKDSLQWKLTLARSLATLKANQVEELIGRLHEEKSEREQMFGIELHQEISEAFLLGYVTDIANCEEMDAAAVVLDRPMLRYIARAMAAHDSNNEEVLRSLSDELIRADSGIPAFCLVVLALGLLDNGRTTAAEAAARRAIELEPGLAVAHYTLGDSLLTAGRLDEAVAPLHQATKLDPTFDGLWRSLGQTLIMTGEFANAAKVFRAWLDYKSNNGEAWAELGYVLIRQKEFAEAENALLSAIAFGEGTPTTIERLVTALEHQQRLSEAISVCQDGLKQHPKSSKLWRKAAAILVQQHDFSFAEDTLLKQAKLIGPAAHSLIALSELYERQEYGGDALAVLRNIEIPDVADPELATALGNRFRAMNCHNDAAAAFRRAVKLAPTDQYPRRMLLRSLASACDHDGALRAAITATKDLPEEPYFWYMRGVQAFAVGDFAGAESAYRRVIELDDRYNDTWSRLGDVLHYYLGQYEEAEHAFQKALELAPDDPATLNNFAWARYLRGVIDDETERLARSAVTHDPDDPYRQHTLAVILARRGNWREAVVYSEKFLANDDHNFFETGFDDIIRFFAEAVAIGRVSEAIELLEDSGLDERWRPLTVALRAIEDGHKLSLRKVAPEVRKPAEDMLAVLLPDRELPDPRTKAEVAALTKQTKTRRKR